MQTTRNLSHKRNNSNDPSKNLIQFRKKKKNPKYISQKKTTQTEAGKHNTCGEGVNMKNNETMHTIRQLYHPTTQKAK